MKAGDIWACMTWEYGLPTNQNLQDWKLCKVQDALKCSGMEIPRWAWRTCLLTTCPIVPSLTYALPLPPTSFLQFESEISSSNTIVATTTAKPTSAGPLNSGGRLDQLSLLSRNRKFTISGTQLPHSVCCLCLIMHPACECRKISLTLKNFELNPKFRQLLSPSLSPPGFCSGFDDSASPALSLLPIVTHGDCCICG